MTTTDDTVTYEVTEGRLIFGSQPHHASTVGRGLNGVHLVLTDEAAGQLARILLRAGELEHLDADTELWTHTAVDLLGFKALGIDVRQVGSAVVYASLHESGYLQPRRREPQRHLEVAPNGERSRG